MNRERVVNPFINYFTTPADADVCAITCPKPGFGMQRLTLSRQSQPKLFDLFAELSNIGYRYLDVDGDLGPDEIDLLVENGVLVETGAIPEQAFYCCLIAGLAAKPFSEDRNNLFVNPSFRFASFDFTNLAERLLYGHLSGRPSAWVSEEVTGIERGYWFDLEQAETVSTFDAGRRLVSEIEPEFLGKLYAAGIVTTERDIEERTRMNKMKLDAAREKYVNDKYCVVEELLPPEQMATMRTYFRKYISNGFMPFEDPQARRFYQHNEPLARVFHKQLTDVMSYVIGEEVIPSYVYAGSYVEHADLNPHCDRAQCEFSISFQVDYLPEQPEHRSPWGLFVWQPDWTNEVLGYDSEEFPAASEAEDTNPAVYLRSGDGLIYKGRELIHYRYPLAAGHQSTSLFFHYVPKDFEGELR